MNGLRRQSLTLRLAWWHAATALVAVIALALFVRQIVSQRLLQELDRQLRIDFDIIEAQVEQSQDNLVWLLRGSHGEEGYARTAAWFEVWSEEGELLLRHWPVPETEAHARLGPPAGQQLRFYSAEVEPELFARIMEQPARTEHRDVVLRTCAMNAGCAGRNTSWRRCFSWDAVGGAAGRGGRLVCSASLACACRPSSATADASSWKAPKTEVRFFGCYFRLPSDEGQKHLLLS